MSNGARSTSRADGLDDGGDAVGVDVAQEHERQMRVFRLDPFERRLRAERRRNPLLLRRNRLAGVLRQFDRDEQPHLGC